MGKTFHTHTEKSRKPPCPLCRLRSRARLLSSRAHAGEQGSGQGLQPPAKAPVAGTRFISAHISTSSGLQQLTGRSALTAGRTSDSGCASSFWKVLTYHCEFWSPRITQNNLRLRKACYLRKLSKIWKHKLKVWKSMHVGENPHEQGCSAQPQLGVPPHANQASQNLPRRGVDATGPTGEQGWGELGLGACSACGASQLYSPCSQQSGNSLHPWVIPVFRF